MQLGKHIRSHTLEKRRRNGPSYEGLGLRHVKRERRYRPPRGGKIRPNLQQKSERGGEQVLPAPFQTHLDWTLPEKGREDPAGQLLVVRQRREAVAPPPLLLVRSLDPGGQKNVEGHRQGLREAPESPASPAAISQTGPN